MKEINSTDIGKLIHQLENQIQVYRYSQKRELIENLTALQLHLFEEERFRIENEAKKAEIAQLLAS